MLIYDWLYLTVESIKGFTKNTTPKTIVFQFDLAKDRIELPFTRPSI